MTIGDLVTSGWRYRRKSIIEYSNRYGIVISKQPFLDLVIVERLQFRKGNWRVNHQQEITDTVDVLWNSGEIEKTPVCNLIEVEK